LSRALSLSKGRSSARLRALTGYFAYRRRSAK
jgi:hypothetical protein